MRITQNPDKELRQKILDALKANDNYCPCRLVKNDDTKCICKAFRDQIERGEEGMCHCGLYLMKND